MSLSRRDLLGASALLLAGRAARLRAATATLPAGQRPIVLCWNENPYGPSPAARRAVSEAIAHSFRYATDDEIQGLRATLAHKEGVSAGNIVIGSGSGELLCTLGLLCAREDGQIIAAEPTYTEMTEYAQRRGATLKFVPVDAQLRHDLGAMRAAVTEHTRAVYVCNPNNPTGTALPAQAIRDFVASLPAGVLTIVDEAYMDFASADIGSVSDLVSSGHRVVVLRTFSKIHGMAGMRLGYAVAPADLVTEMAGARMAYPNSFAVHAAQASLGDAEFLSDTRRRILGGRARITTELTRLNLRYAQSHTNFVFFDTGMPLAQFTTLMQQRQVLVGRLFPPYSNWCRITVGTEPEVGAFLRALRAVHASASVA
jgi:histidinol-phosphate aminotransferase